MEQRSKAWRPSDETIAVHETDTLNLPEAEEMPYVDTMSMQLDRTLELIHGTQAWFDANPDYDRFTFIPPTPDDDLANRDQYHVVITRDNLQTLKEVALTRFVDLKDHSELGYAVAQDVVESWKKPEEHE